MIINLQCSINKILKLENYLKMKIQIQIILIHNRILIKLNFNLKTKYLLKTKLNKIEINIIQLIKIKINKMYGKIKNKIIFKQIINNYLIIKLIIKIINIK